MVKILPDKENSKKYNRYLDYFPIPLDESKLIQLDNEGKAPLGKWDYHTRDWIAFESPTAIQCNWFEHLGLYLCVLDWDYKDKFNNPIFKDFEYSETLIRESKNGLHCFYLSENPREYKQVKENKGGLDIDFKMVSSVNPNSNGGYVKFHPKYIDNGLEPLEIDINKVIASLYESNNVKLEKQGTYYRNSNKDTKIIEEDIIISDYVEALAEYFYYKITSVNPDWKDGYSYSFEMGLKLGGYLKTPEEANGFSMRLMELATVYDKPNQWRVNFINGWSMSDNVKRNNFGGTVPRNNQTLKTLIIQDLSIVEYAQIMHKYTLDNYLTVIEYNFRR